MSMRIPNRLTEIPSSEKFSSQRAMQSWAPAYGRPSLLQSQADENPSHDSQNPVEP